MSLILYISLIFGAFVNSQSLNVITQLSDNIIPTYYDVHLNLTTLEEGFFNGTCRIDIDIKHSVANTIRFHARGIKAFDFFLKKHDTHEDIPDETMYNRESNIYSISFSNKRLIGSYRLTMKFMSDDKDLLKLFKTFYIDGEGSKVWLLAAQTIGARRIFPCWDDPKFQAPFDIAINHLSNHIVLSNMPVRTTQQMWTQFHTCPYVPPYLITIVVANFPRISDKKRINLRFRQQIALHLKYTEMVIKNVTQNLESRCQVCKKVAKVDHVAIPGFHQESMDTSGLVLYRETALIYDEKFDPIIRKIDVARLVGHEITRQCFNWAIFYPMSRSWLKKGILTFLSADIINEVYPEFRMLDLFVVQIQQESLHFDHSTMKRLMSSNEEIYFVSSLSYYKTKFSDYIKAPTMLRMLQYILGYEVFWKGINTFLEQIYKKSISLNFDDLWATMQLVLDKSNNTYKFNIENMMNSWIKLEHNPVLYVTQHNLSHVKIFNENALDQIIIPITFFITNHCNFSMAPAYFLMWIKLPDKSSISCVSCPLFNLPWLKFSAGDISRKFKNITLYDNSILIPSNSCIIMNIQQAGYYRVNYGIKYWDCIIQCLNTSKEYTNIHVLNRAQIIADAFYFLTNNELPLSIFLVLTTYLRREKDYIAWYPMFKALEYMSGYFLFDQSAYIKAHMREILHILLKSITYSEKSNEGPNNLIQCLRQEAAKWACVLNDFDCLSNASNKLRLHLLNNQSFLPNWKEWTYCNGLPNYYDNEWRDVFDRLTDEEYYKLLKYLSCSKSNIIRVKLDIVVNGLSLNCGPKYCRRIKMQPSDRVNNYLLTVAKYAKNDESLKYILENFRETKPREISFYVALINIINHVQSEAQLDKILTFVEDNNKKIKETIISDIFNIIDFSDQQQKKINKTINNIVDRHVVPILIIKQKIDARLSEISSQLYHFQYLLEK